MTKGHLKVRPHEDDQPELNVDVKMISLIDANRSSSASVSRSSSIDSMSVLSNNDE